MKNLVLLHNPRCSKSREAFNYLSESGIKFVVREYLNDNLSTNELNEIAEKLKLDPINFIRKKENDYKENNLKGKSSQEILNAMVSFPKLIERPILISDSSAVIGRPLENIKIFLKQKFISL